MKIGMSRIINLLICAATLLSCVSTAFAAKSEPKQPTCEIVEHVHTDDCWPETGDGPICGYFEHIHNDECYRSCRGKAHSVRGGMKAALSL